MDQTNSPITRVLARIHRTIAFAAENRKPTRIPDTDRRYVQLRLLPSPAAFPQYTSTAFGEQLVVRQPHRYWHCE